MFFIDLQKKPFDSVDHIILWQASTLLWAVIHHFHEDFESYFRVQNENDIRSGELKVAKAFRQGRTTCAILGAVYCLAAVFLVALRGFSEGAGMPRRSCSPSGATDEDWLGGKEP